jgi:hypothetical protein
LEHAMHVSIALGSRDEVGGKEERRVYNRTGNSRVHPDSTSRAEGVNGGLGFGVMEDGVAVWGLFGPTLPLGSVFFF